MQCTAAGHENTEGMACRGVRVERNVRLGRGVESFHGASAYSFWCCTSRVNPRCTALPSRGAEVQKTLERLFDNLTTAVVLG